MENEAKIEFFIIEKNCTLSVVRAKAEERNEHRALIVFDNKPRDNDIYEISIVNLPA